MATEPDSDRLRPVRSGYAEKDGRLLIFELDCIQSIRPYPDLTTRKKTCDAGWHAARPNVRLDLLRLAEWRLRSPRYTDGEWLEPEREDLHQGMLPLARPVTSGQRRASEVLRRWLAKIPKDVFRAVTRLRDRHGPLLVAVARAPGFFELLRDNPALAYALASLWCFHKPAPKQIPRTIRRLVKSRRRCIADFLGFGNSESVVRLLGRIRPEAISINRLLNLRDALPREEAVRLLAHMPRINAGALRLATDHGLITHFSPVLLAEVAASRGEHRKPQAAILLTEVKRMSGLAGHLVGVFNSLGSLSRRHDELAELLQRREEQAIREGGRLTMPDAGLSDGDEVVVLRDSVAITLHARHQGNCAASYIPMLLASAGRLALCAVHGPESATLLAEKVGGRWRIKELAGPKNRPVRAETRRSVERWLQWASGEPSFSWAEQDEDSGDTPF